MVQLSLILLGLAASSVQGAPLLKKRIAQSITAATAKWEQACVCFSAISNLICGKLTIFYQIAAGGAQQCNPISVAAFSTLLAAPGACEQQNSADKMIDLAKTLGNDAEMIRLTQIFAQQPRNTVNTI